MMHHINKPHAAIFDCMTNLQQNCSIKSIVWLRLQGVGGQGKAEAEDQGEVSSRGGMGGKGNKYVMLVVYPGGTCSVQSLD